VSGWPLEAQTASAGGTRAAAGALGALARPGDVVLLVGGLGAGKTTFAQGFARALGVQGPVTSPTFTLVRQYRCGGVDGVRQLVHADVYRLDSVHEVEDLALTELVEDAGVALVEWGDAAAPVLGPDPLRVVLRRPGEPGGPPPGASDPAAGDDEARRVTFGGGGERWAGRRRALAEALGRALGAAPGAAPPGAAPPGAAPDGPGHGGPA